MNSHVVPHCADVVRRVARVTNRLLCGQTLVICGEGPVAAELLRLLGALGAVTRRFASSADYATSDHDPPEYAAEAFVFCTGEQPERVRWADLRPAMERDAIVVDAGVSEALPALSQLASAASTPLSSPRAGVLTVPLAVETLHVVPALQASRLGEPGVETDPAEAPAAAGARRIEWARRFMPITRKLSADLAASGALLNRRVLVSLILEPKTAVLALELQAAGAAVSVFAPANETDAEVAAALHARGVRVFAAAPGSTADDAARVRAALDTDPHLLIDDGSHLIRLWHAHPDAAWRHGSLLGAAEETTSGIRPLAAMGASLRVPVFAVNDAACKTLIDNAHGTGQSCVFAMLDVLAQLHEQPRVEDGDYPPKSLAGVDAVVLGFGPVGQGVARALRAFGARVTITETDPVRALEARMFGYPVAPALAAVATAAVVVSATGVAHTVSAELLRALPAGCAVAVAGGVQDEVDVPAATLEGTRSIPVVAHATRMCRPDGAHWWLLADGAGINYTAGEGNPIEIMDASFGVQVAALALLSDPNSAYPPGLHPLPPEADELVARAALAALRVGCDDTGWVRRKPQLDWRHTRYDAPVAAQVEGS